MLTAPHTRVWPPARSIIAATMRAQWRASIREATERRVSFWPVRPARGPVENEVPIRPGSRSGPMELSELYAWHQARGTLEEFFGSFPPTP